MLGLIPHTINSCVLDNPNSTLSYIMHYVFQGSLHSITSCAFSYFNSMLLFAVIFETIYKARYKILINLFGPICIGY